MPNYNFRLDLPIALKTEKEILEKMCSYGYTQVGEMCSDGRWDFVITRSDKNKTLCVEVKEDFLCEKTHNVGLEFECRGKPSGINKTQSTHYVYRLHLPTGKVEDWIFKTDVLKKMVAERKYFKPVCGGDEGSNSWNYLFYLETFISYGNRI